MPRSAFSDEWLVLRCNRGFRPSWRVSTRLARAVRKELLAHGSGTLGELLSEPAHDGAPSPRPRLAIVPLPFVGHPRAAGELLGVALILPRHAAEGDRRALQDAVATWMGGATSGRSRPTHSLRVGTGDVEISAVDRVPTAATLRAPTWCGPASTWASATPVALDRHPGALHGGSPDQHAAALLATRHMLQRACTRIGLPAPRDVDVLAASPLQGTTDSREIHRHGGNGKSSPGPTLDADPELSRYVLTHVRLAFARPVHGPLLLGADRHDGLGLLRPL